MTTSVGVLIGFRSHPPIIVFVCLDWEIACVSLIYLVCSCEDISLMFSYHAHLSLLPFLTPFNLSFACLISLFAWLSISSAALLCASPFALAFAFSSPFPRVMYQALAFLCVQLSVRGCSTPHALLERRLVKTCTDMYTHNTQYCGDRTFHTVLMIHDALWISAEMMRHTEGVRTLWGFSVGQKIVCACMCVCMHECVGSQEAKGHDSLSHNVSAVQPILSSLMCVPFWFHLRSVWVFRKRSISH